MQTAQFNTAAKPFADAKDGQEFNIEVISEGYDKNYKFTYKANTQYKYVYAGLTWAEYWQMRLFMQPVMIENLKL